MSLLLVTHDMGVAANIADRIIVMYAGDIVEEAAVHEIFTKPHHPYTRGLLHSVTKLDSPKEKNLYSISGSIPNLSDLPGGCSFHPRCPFATDECKKKNPSLQKVNGRLTACIFAEELVKRSDWLKPDDNLIVNEAENLPVTAPKEEVLMEVKHLKKYYPLTRGFGNHSIKAVDDVTFSINKGEVFGLIGESGSGKSTLGRVLLQLEKATSGTVKLQKEELHNMNRAGLRKTRQEMQMIFQDPHGSINPRWKIKDIIAEPLIAHRKIEKKLVYEHVQELMIKVGLKKEWMNRYPHEFSGGQRQRIGIARAIALHPSFIVADEPVSALDVSIQAQIINLIKDLQQSMNLTFLFIGHGLSTVRYISDRVGVMYLGKLMEIAPANELFSYPAHPYTQALIESNLEPDPLKNRMKTTINGEIPSPANPPTGCRFRTRCPLATERCAQEEPELNQIAPGHYAACHYL